MCNSPICIGEFYTNGWPRTNISALQKALTAIVKNRKGTVCPSWPPEQTGETPYIRFHIEGTRYRIHNNCDCDALRWMIARLPAYCGTTDGPGNGKNTGRILAVKTDEKYPKGYYIYHDEK